MKQCLFSEITIFVFIGQVWGICCISIASTKQNFIILDGTILAIRNVGKSNMKSSPGSITSRVKVLNLFHHEFHK